MSTHDQFGPPADYAGAPPSRDAYAPSAAPPPPPPPAPPAPLAVQPAYAVVPTVAPGPVYAPQPYAGYPVVVAAKTNGLAIASLVLGIVWVYWIGSVLAVIFGHVALSQINKSNGTQQGRGMAIAGLVLGWIGVAVLIVWLLFVASVAGSGA
jgi:hypothetical protein